MQHFIELSAAVNELSFVQRKNSDENNTVHRYRTDSNKKSELMHMGRATASV